MTHAETTSLNVTEAHSHKLSFLVVSFVFARFGSGPESWSSSVWRRGLRVAASTKQFHRRRTCQGNDARTQMCRTTTVMQPFGNHSSSCALFLYKHTHTHTPVYSYKPHPSLTRKCPTCTMEVRSDATADTNKHWRPYRTRTEPQSVCWGGTTSTEYFRLFKFKHHFILTTNDWFFF